jgi:hypothetical protein
MKKLLALAVGLLGGLAGMHEAQAGNYVLHFHGRSQGSWTSNTTTGVRMPLADVATNGWTNMTFTYNGNARIIGNETDSSIDVNSVNHALRMYCGTGTGNACIVHCYSTGCYRAMKAIDDIRAGYGGQVSNSLSGMLYMEGSGSAAGGTDLAELATGLFTSWMAKILGQQEAVDYDLTRDRARNYFSYIHDGMPVQFWHVDGNMEICKKLLGFIKICSGGYIAGNDDGVVPWASSAGYSDATGRSSLCNTSAANENDTSTNVTNKYPKHRTDAARLVGTTMTGFVDCDGSAPDQTGMTAAQKAASWDHFGIPDVGERAIQSKVKSMSAATFNYWTWSDTLSSEAACNSANTCDNAFNATTSTDLTKYNDGTATASSSVDGTTSQTYGQTGLTGSCAGRCGAAVPAGWCGCQFASGNKCSDYNAQHCDSVNGN